MLMNNPLVQSPGWWSLPKKKRFEMASAQSMLSPLARVGKPVTIPSGVDPGLRAANARVASGTTIPQMSGKKGLNWEEISEVMSEMQTMEPEFVTDQASQSGQDFKLSLMDQASPDVGNLGLSQEAFWKKKLGYA
jgi:hypothetical protein